MTEKKRMKTIKQGDPGWTEKRQEYRDALTDDFKAGRLGVENGWLVEFVEGCTCAGGGPESNGMHERHCGMDPIMDLVPLDTKFSVPEDYMG